MNKLLNLLFIPIIFLSLVGADITLRGKRIDDTYPVANLDSAQDLLSTYSMYSQNYTSGGGVIDSVDFWLYKIGSPSGDVKARIYAVSSNLPTGAVYAESDVIDASAIATGAAFGDCKAYRFTFSDTNRKSLGSVSSYTSVAVVIYYAGGDGSNKLKVCDDTSASSHGGRQGYYDGSWHLDSSTADLIFQVNVYR